MSIEIKNLQNKVQNYIRTLKLGKDIIIPYFNSCLINKYRNAYDFIHQHRDTSASFGKEPFIAGISLGDTRILSFERR